MNSLNKIYKEQIVPELVKEFELKNVNEAPKLVKVVINVGIGQKLKDKEHLAAVKNTLTRITGQQPVETKARKSISNFKIREGMVVGVKVTMRGKRLWDFVEKLVKVTLPRVRDFRGISGNAFDSKGNYTLGFNEHVSFPEIDQDEVEIVHGMEMVFVVDSKDPEMSKQLLVKLGFPFKKEEKK